VVTTEIPEAFVGAAYNAQLLASGGVEPYKWTATGALPSGLTLSDAGLLSGTPTTAGRHLKLAFTVKDAHGTTASSSSLDYTCASATLEVLTSTCPGGTQYKQYAGCTLNATGGTPPYTWSWLGGAAGFASGKAALPEGLAINAASGAITSPVMIAGQGSYTTMMVVTDAAGASNQTQVTFAINGDNTMGGCSFFPGMPLNSPSGSLVTAETVGPRT
jgi:hypothetical protein